MERFWCPYLSAEVELTDERDQHIAATHPDLLPSHRDRMVETLAGPDAVRRSGRSPNARLFVRWFDRIRGGKHIVVVVISETRPADRHWTVTAYLARKLAE